MRIGVDLGGTKIEVIALDDGGDDLFRKRVPTPRTYEGTVEAIAGLVREVEETLSVTGHVGVGIPGTVSARTRVVKNANHQVLNGHALDQDLSAALDGREVRCMNDANCLAVSEAVDGAGTGQRLVFAVILGTGCGAGFAINGEGWSGGNLVAGEFGHNPLPWMTDEEFPGYECWCGQRGCIEKYVSGTGFADDYNRHSDRPLKNGEEIIAAMRSGDAQAKAAFERYTDRLARALSHVINLIDPDVIVLGGGMSNVDELYNAVPPLLQRYVFGGEVDTPVLKSKHGDSSGVRGAAWLWPMDVKP